MSSLAIKVDLSALHDLTSEIKSLAAQCPSELRDAFGNRLIQLLENGGVDVDRVPTSAADECLLGVVFRDDLQRFMAAARAGDFEFDPVAHVASSGDAQSKHSDGEAAT